MQSHENDPALHARAEETQNQFDSEGVQFRTAASGPAGRDSTSIAGHNFSHASAKGDIVGGNKTKKTAINLGAVAVVIGIAIGLIIGGKYIVDKVTGTIGTSISQATITNDSTCGEYLQQSPADRNAAIMRIGLDLHVQGVGSPLMMPEVDYECGRSPDTKFGTVLSRQHGY